MGIATDFMARYYAERKAHLEKCEAKKEAIFTALASAGIATVEVLFDGEGDSGQIDSIEAKDAHEEVVNLPTVEIGGEPLYNVIEELCYAYMEDKHAGWEDNEGAYGKFLFEVAERTIHYEHNTRVMETVFDEYEL